ncbi:MAG: PAS domain S-box protein [Anaerolineales bacterium]|nr:PAS domain S-box protein [Anaerolineales bacterium]
MKTNPKLVRTNREKQGGKPHFFEGILQASSDGILAVNLENEVLFANQRFAEMWRIPPELLKRKDDALLLESVLDQLSDPQGFLGKVRELYNSADESFDTLYFKDGRIFERLSRPLLDGPRVQGRVWSFRDITERKRAEEETREAEERLELFFSQSLDGFFFMMLDEPLRWDDATDKERALDYAFSHMRITRVNDAMLRQYGATREQFLGLTPNDFFAHDPAQGKRVWRRFFDEGRLHIETDERRFDGSQMWIEGDYICMHDAAGRITGHFGIQRDITERKRIEEALADSEAELRALFASMHDVVLVIDREGVYRKIGPTNPSLLVRPPAELLGKNLRDVFPSSEAETFRAVAEEVLQTNQVAHVEYELLINGQPVWFQATISPLDAETTLWVAHDITGRKEMEEALRTAEANYRSIFEYATVGIYQSTPEGRSLRANPMMARIFGYDSPEDFINGIASMEMDYYANPADRQEFQRRITDEGEVHGLISENKRKDGAHIWTQESARVVRDANGNILYYEGFVADITERKRAEEELQRARDALEEINRELQGSLEREKLLACTDGLTGLYNHRHFFELAAREFHAALRHRRPLAFLMFDMDEFKGVNDSLGHAAGDRLLARVAEAAVAQVRASDVIARYGGDEFIALLPHASAQQALPVAERIRASVASLRIEGMEKIPEITLSIGIAELVREPPDEKVERVIQRADEALYAAKAQGRNRTVVYGTEPRSLS